MLLNALKGSLRAKVTLGVVFPLVAILGVFTAIAYSRYQATVLANLSILASLSGQAIESNLRHAMLDSDFTEVRTLLNTLGKEEAFRVVYVLDSEGQVIFAPNNEGVGTQLDNKQPDCQPCHRLPPDQRPKSVVVTASDEQRVFRSMQPILNGPACVRCHVSEQRVLGLLLTDISVHPMEAALADDLRENVFWWLAAILVTVIVVNIVLSRLVLGRLEGLAAAITRLGEGQPPLALPENQPDEIGQLATAFDTMAHQVEEREVENRRLSEDLSRQHTQRGQLLKNLITAQENERQRVARELHDELGQQLGGLALRVEALARHIGSDSSDAVAQLEQIRRLTGETTDRMYDLILDLRPSALDDLGLVAALRIYAERLLTGTGIVFELNADRLTTRLPPTIELALYRIFQETMNNAVRHARAKHILIRLTPSDDQLEGEIIDDGRGFDPDAVRRDGQSPRGLGLLGIQERVTQCGGHLEIRSQPGMGTHICILIPLMEDNPHD